MFKDICSHETMVVKEQITKQTGIERIDFGGLRDVAEEGVQPPTLLEKSIIQNITRV